MAREAAPATKPAHPIGYQAASQEWCMSMMMWSAPPEGNETSRPNVLLQDPTLIMQMRVAYLVSHCACWSKLHSSPALSEVADVVSTARIERPPLYRGGSAS